MKRARSVAVGAVCLVAAAGVVVSAVGADAALPGAAGPATQTVLGLDVGRAPIAPGDGWASFNGGTTGGAAAAIADEKVVTNRAELVAALGGNNVTNATNAKPKIIYVKGRISADVDDAGKPLTCADYAAGTGYSLEAYLKAYDPATFGLTAVPSGEQEIARDNAKKNQQRRMRLNVGSNTTIVGVDKDAVLDGVALNVTKVDNVIVRNLTMISPRDCFPQWDPTDGETGNWNSAYDSIGVSTATNVWIDHNTFTDAPSLDKDQPKYFDRTFQQHDGVTDINKESDLVTVSYNRYEQHNKTMLIGSSDVATSDAGKLRVSIHHNLFKNVGQRTPRVRFGQVDVYNNSYVHEATSAYPHLSSIAAGAQSHIRAENNSFTVPESIPAAKLFQGAGAGRVAFLAGNEVNGAPVDLLAAFNATAANPVAVDTTWTSVLRGVRMSPAKKVAVDVARDAGAGVLKGTSLQKQRVPVPAGTVLTVDPAATPSATSFTTVAAAVAAVPEGNTAPVLISVAPGSYQGSFTIPATKPFITIRGASGNPRDAVITDNRASGTLKADGTATGTTGSATLTVLAKDTTLRNITVANAFDEAADPTITSKQAVAVKTQADRIVFDRVRLLGNQDTFYANAKKGEAHRVFVDDSYIAGDVDFVFGSATMAVKDTVLHALAERATKPSGYITAASTDRANSGYLIDSSFIVSDAAAGTYFLGRPWHPSNDVDAIGQVFFRETVMSAAVGTPAWTNMSGFLWTDARFAEFGSGGPGAATGEGRPQLTPAQANAAKPSSWLAGTDGWAPTTGR